MLAIPASVFEEPNVWKKLQILDSRAAWSLNHQSVALYGLAEPARDVQVLPAKEHPAKVGFAKIEGQARLLHDLASIELQAMELALRTLEEFPDAPIEFRQELAELTLSEGRHLELCLKGLQDLGFQWGHWPVHVALWLACSAEDSLIERIFIVHRYFEGSGLDATSSILSKLSVGGNPNVLKIVEFIRSEEVEHVAFGSRWFHKLRDQSLSEEEIFLKFCHQLGSRLPNRFEKPNREWRLKAGFTLKEVEAFEKYQKFRRQPRDLRRIV